MKPASVLLALALLLSVAPAAGQSGWTSKRLAGDLAQPVDMVFGPDGTLYYAELNSGKLRAIPPESSTPLPDAVIQVDASGGDNGGFLGVALDPDFETTGAFFVYYSFEKADATNGKVNRVSRVDANGERVLLDDIPWAAMHDGGRIVFTGPDTLVVTTGDNELRDPAQDPKSLLGKTLRMTRDGSPAPDNPTAGSYVYTLGHRNAFGLAYDAASGTLWSTENGPSRGDEVNILVAGGNYGWPKHLGATGAAGFVDPVVEYDEPIGPTGATVFGGDLYFGDFNDGSVHRVTRAPDGSYQASVIWSDPGQVLDVEAGPDGKLYVSSYREIYVLTPPADLAPPTPASTPATATPAVATAPATTSGAPPSATPPASTPPVATPAAPPSAPATSPRAPPAASPEPAQESTGGPTPTPEAQIPGATVVMTLAAALVAAVLAPRVPRRRA